MSLTPAKNTTFGPTRAPELSDDQRPRVGWTARPVSLWVRHTRSDCDWQILSYAVGGSRVALESYVAGLETSLLVTSAYGKEVAMVS